MRINILFLIIFIYASLISQGNFVFSEIESGYNYSVESNEPNETSFLLRSDLFFDRPDLTFILSNQLEQYTGNYKMSNLSTALSLEKRFSDISNNTLFQYQEKQIEEYRSIDLSNTFFWNNESVSGVSEAGFNFTWQHYLEQLEYEELSGNLYFLKKKYFSNFSLHQKFDMNFMKVFSREEVSKILPNIKYEIHLTAPLTKDIGISLKLDLNQNLETEERILIPNENFYNSASYNSQTISTVLTFIKGDYLIKPRFSATRRKYLSLAVEDKFRETELNSGFYFDFIFPQNLLIYTDLDFSWINDTSGWNDFFYVASGLKYQFDLYVR